MSDLHNDSEWQDVDPSPVVWRAWCGDCPWQYRDDDSDMCGGYKCGLLGGLELDWYDAPIAACEADDDALDEWLSRGSIHEDSEVAE